MDEIRTAQLLGTHATAFYFATLATLLVVVALCWQLVRRAQRGFQDTPMPPARLLWLRMGIGFAIALAAGLAFAELAEALGVSDDLARFDMALTGALRVHVGADVLPVFALVTRLGDTGTLTVLCVAVGAALMAASRHRLALAWVLAVAGNGALNRLLKAVFQRVRPDREHDLVSASGWSFPSGHSSGSVVAYGMLAYVVLHFVPPRWQLPVLLLASALALTIGLSRVFLQVHYLSDVLAGFASGLMWLTICIVSSEWWHSRRRAPVF